MKKPTIDVVPSGREWLVKRSDEEVAISRHTNEAEAAENAQRIAEIEETEVAFHERAAELSESRH